MIAKELRQEGIPVTALGGSAGVLLPHQLGRLMQTFRELRPEVVHSWMYHANVVAQGMAALGRRDRRPAVITSVRASLDTPEADKMALRAVRRVDSWLSRWADAVVFNSRRSAEQHDVFGYSPERAEVIPNCFDTDRFRPKPEERESVRAGLGWNGAVAIGLVARFDPIKDHRTFLQAARLVRTHSWECRFVLVGPGCDPGNRDLMRWIRESDVIESVYPLGERNDVAAIQGTLDVAVNSSTSESFPNAIGEAMACGTPCVVTDVGDSGFLVGDTGFVVSPGDPVALANAIIRMINLPIGERRNLGERARRRIMAEFSISSVVDKFATLYERCVSKRRARPAPQD